AKVLRVGVAAAVVAAVGIGAAVVGYRPAAAQDKQPDKDRLQGVWVVTAAKKNGQDPPDRDQIVGQKMTFDGDKMRFAGFEVAWAVDPTKTPREIDCTILVGPENEKGKVSRGVYRLDGDKLTLHVSHPGGGRPGGFESKEGESTVLLHLERAKK
ncbi:TIGR03067 domain-containing protein, partial [bacterium]|nr:TIGR03067 domain-containing protein [bacterium]